MEPRTLVIICKRALNGEGRCRRCGHPVMIDAAVARALAFGAAMLCVNCSTELYQAGERFDPAEIIDTDD